MSAPAGAHEARAEELFPSTIRRPHPATDELRREADRRRALVARRVMNQVARLPYYAARARSAKEADDELRFWLGLVEFGDEAVASPAQVPLTDTGRRPDRCSVRLAVGRVAELLQPLDRHSELSLRDTQAVRLRTASWAVLHCWRIDAARLYYLQRLDQPVDPTALERAIELPRHDWIAEAARQLGRDGRAGR